MLHKMQNLWKEKTTSFTKIGFLFIVGFCLFKIELLGNLHATFEDNIFSFF